MWERKWAIGTIPKRNKPNDKADEKRSVWSPPRKLKSIAPFPVLNTLIDKISLAPMEGWLYKQRHDVGNRQMIVVGLYGDKEYCHSCLEVAD